MILAMKMGRLTHLNFGMHHCLTEKMKMQNLNMRLKLQTYWIPVRKIKVMQAIFR